jgi:hypothetical protein
VLLNVLPLLERLAKAPVTGTSSIVIFHDM